LDAENKINLNLAARDDLMRLPGIGEVMANRIIERRPYKSVEALLEVSGIGDKSLAQIRPYVKLSD
jgi:DNA uptake protein ComE-like DNA-binding protein